MKFLKKMGFCFYIVIYSLQCFSSKLLDGSFLSLFWFSWYSKMYFAVKISNFVIKPQVSYSGFQTSLLHNSELSAMDFGGWVTGRLVVCAADLIWQRNTSCLSSRAGSAWKISSCTQSLRRHSAHRPDKPCASLCGSLEVSSREHSGSRSVFFFFFL